MAEEKFLLVGLDDDKSKSLASVISSHSSRKILDLLADKPLSETDIANKLNIPLTTVHYNIKQLLNANLIQIHDFLWSDKGKKVNYYKLSNKLIIIAPSKNSSSFLEKLGGLIPVALTGLIASICIYIYQSYNSGIMRQAKYEAAQPMVATTVMDNSTLTLTQNYALWFFLGFLSFLILYLIIEFIKVRFKKD